MAEPSGYVGRAHFFMAFALAFMAFILFMAFGASAAAFFMRFIGMVSELKVYLANLVVLILSQSFENTRFANKHTHIGRWKTSQTP